MLPPGALSSSGAYAALVAVTMVHLGAQAFAPGGLVADLTQVLLMPILAWVLVTSSRAPTSRVVRLALLALGLSWLGDTLPRLVSDDDLGFALMLGAFLLAQFAYIAAFIHYADRSIARTRPLLLLPYLLVFAGLIAECAKGAGSLLPAVVIYGLAIITMAVLATGIDRVATLGGVVFLASDALIAVRAFGDMEVPFHDVWVMLTYVVAQTLLVAAIANHDRMTRPRPRADEPTRPESRVQMSPLGPNPECR